MKKRLGTNKTDMKGKIVSIAIGLAMVLIAISSVGAVPENDTINQTNDTVNASDAVVGNTSNTMPKKPIDDGPIVNIPDKEFMPEYRESVIVYFKQMPPSIKGFARKHGMTPIFVKEDIKMVGFETMPEGKGGEVSQKTLDVLTALSNEAIVEKVFKDEYRFINAKKNYSATPIIQGPQFYENLGLVYDPHKVLVQFWRLPPSLDEFAANNGATLKELSEADKFFLTAEFNVDDVSVFINKISSDPYIKFIGLDARDPNIATLENVVNRNVDNVTDGRIDKGVIEIGNENVADTEGNVAESNAESKVTEEKKAPGFEIIVALISVSLLGYMKRMKRSNRMKRRS